MLKAKQSKELLIQTPNEPGALAAVSKLVAEKGINILAMNCWLEGDATVLRLVTDDMLRTTDTLREGGYKVAEKDVVLVDAAHKPGILRHITDMLAREDIDLSHLFASATINQDVCLVVLNSSNNERAMVLLNE